MVVVTYISYYGKIPKNLNLPYADMYITYIFFYSEVAFTLQAADTSQALVFFYSVLFLL